MKGAIADPSAEITTTLKTNKISTIGNKYHFLRSFKNFKNNKKTEIFDINNPFLKSKLTLKYKGFTSFIE